MLEKIGEAEVNGLLLSAADSIRTLESENARLTAQLATRARSDHAEKIASVAVDRGLMDEDDGQEYARDLAKSDKDLGVVEDILKRSAKGIPLGHTKTASAHDMDRDASGDDVLTAFLKTSTPE